MTKRIEGKTKEVQLETVESLQKQIDENKQRQRELKKADSELNLQIAVSKMNDDTEEVRSEILRACYNYIANHRKR